MRASLAFLLIVLAPSAGAAGAGVNTFDFLKLDADARSVAMGGAYTAQAVDANALLYNPAGLGGVSEQQAVFMHNEYFQDVTQEYLAYASPWGLGAGLDMLRSGDIPKTSVSNPNGTGLGSVNLSAFAAALGYGRRLGAGVSAGASVEFLRQSIAGYVGQGYGLGLGGMYEPEAVRGLRLGLSLLNLGPGVRYQSATEGLPTLLRTGAAYTFRTGVSRNTVAFDVVEERAAGATYALGAEALLWETAAVRLGYDSRNDAGPGITFGLGWRHGPFKLDYAFVPFGDLGIAHRVSVGWAWGPPGQKVVEARAVEQPASAAVPKDSSERLLRDAEGAVAGRRYPAAKAMLDHLEQTHPTQSMVLAHIAVIRGDAAYAQDQSSQASDYFAQAAFALSGHSGGDLASRAYAGLARIALKAGDLTSTAQMLRKALDLAPDAEYAAKLRGEFIKLRDETRVHR